MASAISNWYHNQYASWNRTRRMQASPFLARADTQATRLARAASGTEGGQPGDTVINMGDLLPGAADRTQVSEKKKQDTLFGPSIGIVSPGPEWAEQKLDQSEKSQVQDVLTPEMVKSWVEKSKEASQPTTTLQALVNLKRPSLRLSPIHHDEPEDSEHHQHHGLEFQFDCDAPKCGISLHIISPPSGKEASSSSGHLVDVFHTVVEGGFGRVLKLEEGATLELDKFDSTAQLAAASTATIDEAPAIVEQAPTTGTPDPVAENAPHQKKRFTLRIRKRTHPHASEDVNRVSVAGPALQVVDVETPSESATAQEKEAKERAEGGVKVLIRLEALDADEHTLASPNSQATYLHILRLGPAPTPPTQDTRPWVVRVVKREATIGPHTFHLHEIYGLSSHAPAPVQEAHTYPPTGADADDPTSECLLCLSSPREVVLLPCRHLVACKECAVNMVEFGAGGQLVHAEETPADTTPSGNNATAPGEASGEGSGGTGGEEAPPAQPQPPPRSTNPRRKRKAKGWFCPVCRQPYTSLLRISTTAPSGTGNKTKQLENEGVTPSPPVPSNDTSAAPTTPASPTVTSQRPGFLRAISNAAARVTGTEGNVTTGATGREDAAVNAV